MNRLFFETSSKISIIALQSGEKFESTKKDFVWGEAKIFNNCLVEKTEEIMKNNSLSLEEIDEFYVCIGPGSFTGIRLGLSFVKALCYSLNKPLLTFASFSLYRKLSPSSSSIILLSASSKNFYAAFYKNSKTLSPDRLIEKENLEQEIKNLQMENSSCISDVDPKIDLPLVKINLESLSKINFFGDLNTKRYQGKEIFSIEPYYLRSSQAEASHTKPPMML